jgi:hypothetical protein
VPRILQVVVLIYDTRGNQRGMQEPIVNPLLAPPSLVCEQQSFIFSF